MKKKNHLLEGSVLKSIFLISTPIILSNILQTIYQFIDTFWVGRLGEDAVAAVSLGFPIMFFLHSIVIGFTTGGSILISQYNGRKDYEKTALLAGQTLTFVGISSIILSVFGYFTANFFLSYLTEDPYVLSEATKYLQISFLGMTALFTYTVFQSSLQSIGEMKVPMAIVLFTVILNFFLDPILMFGWWKIPAMGVEGVAIATFITESLSGILGLMVLFFCKYNVKLSLKSMIPNPEWIKKIFKLGLPTSLEMSSRSFGMFLMMFIVSTFGTTATAAYGIGTKILGFIIIPAIGFSIATSTLIGNNIGARQHKRAEEISITAIKVGFFTLFTIGILIFISAEKISTFFVPNEPELIKIASLFIKIISTGFGLIGIQMVIGGTLKGASKTKTSMFLTMGQTFTLFVSAYILAVIFKLNEFGIWLAYPIANILITCLEFYLYKQKSWLKKEIK